MASEAFFRVHQDAYLINVLRLRIEDGIWHSSWLFRTAGELYQSSTRPNVIPSVAPTPPANHPYRLHSFLSREASKRRICRLNAKHPSRSFFSRMKVRRKRIRPESDPENMNETRPRDKATVEQQEMIEQIVHIDSTNTDTILVGSKHEETKQRRANYSRGYDYAVSSDRPRPRSSRRCYEHF